MKFKVFMVNKIGNYHEEAVIANNEYEAKRSVQTFNPMSKVLKAKWVYK